MRNTQHKTLDQLSKQLGGPLQYNSKLGCLSFSLSAKKCRVGSILAKKAGYTCSDCYAARGRFMFPNVVAAYAQRLRKLWHFGWVDAMVAYLDRKVKPHDLHFRWHSSGDLQNKPHFKMVCEVARRLPHIKFWLPTMERYIVRSSGEQIPPNLIVRFSAHQYDKRVESERNVPTSGVKKVGGPRSASSVLAWQELVKTNNMDEYHCMAPIQDGKCQSCRACWNPDIKHIWYKHH